MTSAAESVQLQKQPRLWLSIILVSLLLAAEIYVLLYDLGPNEHASKLDRPVIASFQKSFHEVRKKQAGTITWLIPQSGDSLYREDTILTMADSQASVQFTDNSEMTIEPESLVVLEKLSQDGQDQYPKIVLKLVQGSIQKKGGGRLPVAITLPSKMQIEDATGNASFSLKATPEGVSVKVESGSLKVGDKTGSRSVEASQEAVIKENRIEVSETPIYYSELHPANETRVVREQKDSPIKLNWQQKLGVGADPKLKTKIMVSKFTDFHDAIETTQNFIPQTDGSYFWRLEAESKGKPVVSQSASFVVVTKLAPNPKTPTVDTAKTIGEPIRFEWDQISAEKVLLETSNNPEFHDPKTVVVDQGTNFAEISDFERPQIVYWRLRADYGKEVGQSVPSLVRKIVIKAKPILKAPKVQKAKVHFDSSNHNRSSFLNQLYQLVDNFLFQKAFADEPKLEQSKTNVTITLEWDEIEEANQYHLQVAASPNFKKLLLDQKVKKTGIGYRTTQGEKTKVFYFRVAGVNAEGEDGPFSAPQAIEIEAKAKPVVVPRPPKAVPKKNSDSRYTKSELSLRTRFRAEVTLGAAYHTRSFKSDTLPTTVAGSGMIPAFAGFEGRLAFSSDDPNPLTFDFAVSLLAEKAEPTTSHILNVTYPLPLLRSWVMVEKEFFGFRFGAGPYASTSAKFSYVTSKTAGFADASSERTILAGLGLSIANSATSRNFLHWRFVLSPIAMGGMGGDAAASVRAPILAGHSVRAVDGLGFFGETEALARFLNIESSFGGVVKLGYGF